MRWHPPAPGSQPANPAAHRAVDGFTLVEVVAALAVLTTVLLVVAQLLIIAARAAEASRETTLATTLAAQKVEQLRSLAWGIAPDGTTADDFACDVARWPTRPSGGSGLTPSPPGTLGTNASGYVDYLDSTGQWLGEGSTPPGATAFVRRWSIERPAASSPATLTLRVVVLRRVSIGPSARSATPSWVPVIQLDSAKARRGE